MSYIILLPLIFNELRLSGDGIARKRRFGPTPVDHFVDVNEMVYRLASHFLPDLVLSQMIMPVAMTDKNRNAKASSTISMFFNYSLLLFLQACEPLLTRLGIEPDDYCNHYSEERCKCHYCVNHILTPSVVQYFLIT